TRRIEKARLQLVAAMIENGAGLGIAQLVQNQLAARAKAQPLFGKAAIVVFSGGAERAVVVNRGFAINAAAEFFNHQALGTEGANDAGAAMLAQGRLAVGTAVEAFNGQTTLVVFPDKTGNAFFVGHRFADRIEITFFNLIAVAVEHELVAGITCANKN